MTTRKSRCGVNAGIPLLTAALLLLLSSWNAAAVSHTQRQRRIHQEHATNKTHYVFAVVPKALGVPFFEPVEEGCIEYAERLSEDYANKNDTQHAITVECLFVGPSILDGQAQADMVESLLWGTNTTFPTIDGLAISVQDDDIMTPVLQRAINELQIPIVTFDSDAPLSGRSYYIGTNNSFLGSQLARAMETLMPDGGTYGIIADNTPNVRDRVQGILAELNHQSNWHHRWKQLPDSPFDSANNITATIDQMEYWTIHKDPVLLVSVLGFPMQIFTNDTTQQSYSPWEMFVDNVARDRNITLLCADAMPHQLDMLQSDYVDGLVGQLPYDMGSKAIDTLFRIVTDPDNAQYLGDHVDGDDGDEEFIGTNVLSHIHIPLRLPAVAVDNNLIGGLQYVGYTLFAVVAATGIGFGCWAFLRRKVRVVRVAQPRFLIMIAVGVLLMASCMIPSGMDDGAGEHGDCFDNDVSLGEHCTAICMSVPWLFSLGFTITFSALYSKTRRVNKIFRSNTAFGRVKVSERDVLVPFFVLLFLNVVILVVWTIVDPLTYIRVADYGRDGWNRVIATYGTCSSEKMEHFLIPLAVVNVGVLILANWQAYEARDIESEFSETKYIGICMASMLQAMITGIPVLFVVSKIPAAYYMVFVLLIFVVCMVILLVIFVPKIRFASQYMQMSPKAQKEVMREIIRKASKASSNRTPRFGSDNQQTTPGLSSSLERPARFHRASDGTSYDTPPAHRRGEGDKAQDKTPPAEETRPASAAESESSVSEDSCMCFVRKSAFPADLTATKRQFHDYNPDNHPHEIHGCSHQHQHPSSLTTGLSMNTTRSVHKDVIEEGDEEAHHSERDAAPVQQTASTADEEKREMMEAAVPVPPGSGELRLGRAAEGHVTEDSQVFVSELESPSVVDP